MGGVRPEAEMSRSHSSQRWLKEHFNDEFVKRAQREGYRSRAVYKLQELNEKERLLRPGMVVVDLGAAPGGWTQYAAPIVGPKGMVIAMDILPMEPVPGVTLLTGDFRDEAVLGELVALLGGRKIDLVLSDMAPNSSGVKAVDQPRAMYLVELAVEFALAQLAPGGDFLAKAFQGEGFDAVFATLKGAFAKVATRKPKASRGRSPELYLLARNYRL